MSWLDYYRLLEKYGGDIKKATAEEVRSAVRGNPNEPYAALALASRKFAENHPELPICTDKDGNCEEDNCRCNQ